MKNFRILLRTQKLFTFFMFYQLLTATLSCYLHCPDLLNLALRRKTASQVELILLIFLGSQAIIVGIWTAIVLVLHFVRSELWSAANRIYSVLMVFLNAVMVLAVGYRLWLGTEQPNLILLEYFVLASAAFLSQLTMVQLGKIAVPRRVSLTVDPFQNPLISRNSRM